MSRATGRRLARGDPGGHRGAGAELDGTQLLVKTYERLSYLTSGTRAAPISSVPALTKTVREPEIAALCARVIRALDPKASGCSGSISGRAPTGARA